MENEALSILKIKDLLIVSVPTEPDDKTITELQDKVLTALGLYHTKGLILDLSLVEVVDSFFARTIGETAQMVRIMGGQIAIAGMKPSIAITCAQLGFSLGNVLTALNLDMAIDMIENAVEKGHNFEF
jgi:rsbT antagonist protein RsbS